MTDLLKEIIEVDKAARKRVEQATEEKNRAYASVASEKEALIRAETQKARKKAEAISEQGRLDGEKQLEAIRKKNKVILEKMDNLFAENREQWVNEIVAAVLARPEV